MVVPLDVCRAAMEYDVEYVRRWLGAGGDVNDECPWYDQETRRELDVPPNLLHCAVGYRDFSLAAEQATSPDPRKIVLLRLLVARGANVNAGPDGTVLHFCDFAEEAALLVDAGAEVNHRDLHGETPLMALVELANTLGSLSLARFLLRSGADVHLVDNHGRDAEAHARRYIKNYENRTAEWRASHTAAVGVNRRRSVLADLLAAVKRAGTWKCYVRQPHMELVRLRLLCARGRATPPPRSIHERLFGESALLPGAKRRVQNTRPLPKEVFWHILAFWRSTEDDEA